jgi:hypothetical protein
MNQGGGKNSRFRAENSVDPKNHFKRFVPARNSPVASLKFLLTRVPSMRGQFSCCLSFLLTDFEKENTE